VSITINLVSVPVNNQPKALKFYTEKFGFEKRADVSQGNYRWLTVTAPEGSPDVELVLEPNVNPASKSYQESLREQGIPITAFFSNDLDAEYERLVALGVTFTKELTDMPWGKFAILDDTCGNLVQLQQVNFTAG
jgi:predicted enzyme related to lactoylglutathione lyase